MLVSKEGFFYCDLDTQFIIKNPHLLPKATNKDFLPRVLVRCNHFLIHFLLQIFFWFLPILIGEIESLAHTLLFTYRFFILQKQVAMIIFAIGQNLHFLQLRWVTGIKLTALEYLFSVCNMDLGSTIYFLSVFHNTCKKYGLSNNQK